MYKEEIFINVKIFSETLGIEVGAAWCEAQTLLPPSPAPPKKTCNLMLACIIFCEAIKVIIA